ncbi:hypothetical protein D3C71_2115620 [compost metagenome]
MFLSVSSCGIEPICSSTIRLPTRSWRTDSASCSRTVAGLPAITSWLSTKSLNLNCGIRERTLFTCETWLRMVLTIER